LLGLEEVEAFTRFEVACIVVTGNINST
jgi:hypothetical protein